MSVGCFICEISSSRIIHKLMIEKPLEIKQEKCVITFLLYISAFTPVDRSFESNTLLSEDLL